MAENLKDNSNNSFRSDTDKVYSEDGIRFHREKYVPKLERIRPHLNPNASKALDVGIGYGSMMLMLSETLGLTPHGLDPYPASIDIARRYTSHHIHQGRIEDLDWGYPEESFDLITCLDVTEHLEDPRLFYKHAKTYLKPGGLLLMTTPLREFPYEMRSWPVIGIPDLNETHINVHPPAYWDKLAHAEGYELIDQWRGEHFTHVKYVSGLLRRLCNLTGINPKTTPVIRSFQQAYNQVLRLI